jgi:regulator of protease activity HflC (stomatin/prohibitin superfamily)
MRKMFVALLAVATLTAGCTRIETGEVGLRVNASKEVQGAELMPGTWNQTVIGSVLEFPVRDIAGTLENKAPLTQENVALADFDLTFVYGINPSAVSELWTTRSRALHDMEHKDGVLLMKKYMDQLVNNAAYKAIREYPALVVNDKRAEIEAKIRETVAETLKGDKLDTSLTLNLVQVRAIVPPQSILDSAAAVVRSQNDLKVKENEVNIARKEAERMQALSQNGRESIEYMNAQARLNWSLAALQGKVNSVVVDQNVSGKVITNIGK